MRIPHIALGLILCLAPLHAAPPAAPAPRTPVILVTDIGTDIDDCWALALVLRSPELDLRLVLTETIDTRYRAAVTARFLEGAGRTDIPVAIGDNSGSAANDKKTLSPWVAGYDLSKYPGRVYEDGIAAFISAVESSPRPVTVIAIGPVPTLAKVLQRAPDIAGKCRLVGMFGSFDRGYGGGPVSAEWNVKVDPAALRTVLAAPWRDILITPLDTCGLVSLSGGRYHAIWAATADPLLRTLVTSYCIFAPRQDWMSCDYFSTRSTTLYDAVAAYLAYSEELVETETIRFNVTDDGFTRRAADGPFTARVAIRWRNMDGFEAQLAGRLLSP